MRTGEESQTAGKTFLSACAYDRLRARHQRTRPHLRQAEAPRRAHIRLHSNCIREWA